VKLLAVETATSRQSVALLDGQLVVDRLDRDSRGSHAKWLVPTIDGLLQANGLTLSDLEGLAISIGPGSFTGLRVGLATMMGFRAVTGRPLVAVPTLEALAWNLRGAAGPVCPILRARTGEVYWAVYCWNRDGGLRRTVPEQVAPVERVARSLRGPVIVLGEGWMEYRDEWRRLLGDRSGAIHEAPGDAMAASAVSVGLAALDRLGRGEVAGLGLAPRYVQRTEAELAWAARHAER
jgi:tRNA threonylcarbamoyladenosine biosynthesis protein TsaB